MTTVTIATDEELEKKIQAARRKAALHVVTGMRSPCTAQMSARLAQEALNMLHERESDPYIRQHLSSIASWLPACLEEYGWRDEGIIRLTMLPLPGHVIEELFKKLVDCLHLDIPRQKLLLKNLQANLATSLAVGGTAKDWPQTRVEALLMQLEAVAQ